MFKNIYILYLYTILFVISTCAISSALESKTITIPPQYGTIKEQFESDNEAPLIVYIQDIHTSSSAQKSIAQIIRYLNKNDNISIITLEGASGLISTEELSRFPDKSVKEQVADYFLKKGEIDGAEYFSIIENPNTISNPFNLYGIEDKKLYKRNLNAYLSTLEYQKSLKDFFYITKKNVQALKLHIYSPMLIEFDESVQSFTQNNEDFLSYCTALIQFADKYLVSHDYFEQLSNLQRLQMLESEINFEMVDAETSLAINTVSRKLPDAQSQAIIKKEFEFRLKRIDVKEYYTYVASILKAHGISLDTYPALEKYLTYLSVFSQLDNTLLLEQSTQLKQDIYHILITNNDEKTLHQIDTYLATLQKFTSLQVSLKNIDEFESYAKKINVQFALNFIERKSKSYHIPFTPQHNLTTIQNNLNNLKRFYIVAREREHPMVTNLLALISKKSAHRAILITGGFHTDGIRSILRSKHISYVIVSPHIEQDKTPIPYLSLLSDFKTPLERLISVQTSTLKIASWLTAEPLGSVDTKFILLTKMKMLFATTKLYNLYTEQLSKLVNPEDINKQKSQIENTLLTAINKVLQLAGYTSTIRIESIQINQHDIVTQIRFARSDGTFSPAIFISSSHAQNTNFVKPEIAKNFLEVINFSNGQKSEFLDFQEYTTRRLRTQLIQAQIFQTMQNNTVAQPILTQSVRSTLSPLAVSEQEVLDQIQALLNMNLLIQPGMDTYMRNTSPESQITALILSNIATQYTHYKSITKIGTVIFPIRKLPDSILVEYPNISAKLSAIIIDPSISPDKILSTIRTMLEFGKDLQNNFSSLKQSTINQTVRTELVSAVIDGKSILYITSISGTANTINHTTKSLPEFEFSEHTVSLTQPKIHSLEETKQELWDMAKQGITYAEMKLVDRYMPLVNKVTTKMFYIANRSPYYRSQLTKDDLLSSAFEALLTSIRAFKPQERGYNFEPYAYVSIRNKLRQSFGASSWLSLGVRKQLAVLGETVKTLTEELNHSPSEEEIADYMNTSAQKIAQLRRYARQSNLASLDQPIGDDEDSTTLGEMIADKTEPLPLDELVSGEERKIFLTAIKYLSDREREIISEYFIEGKSLTKIGEIYNMSPYKIKLIQQSTLAKLHTLIEIISQRGEDAISDIEQTAFSVIDDLTPQDREIMYLLYADSIDETSIMELLGFSSKTDFQQRKNSIFNNVKHGIIRNIIHTQDSKLLTENILDWQIIFSTALSSRQAFMADVLQDLITRSSDQPFSFEQMQQYINDYDDILSLREQEVVLLRHYEGYTDKEISGILNIPTKEIQRIFRYVLQKLNRIITVRILVPIAVRKNLAEIALPVINTSTLLNRKILEDYFYEGKNLTQISKERDMLIQVVGERRNTLLRKLQTALSESITTSLPDISVDLTDPNNLKGFEDFFSGLIFDIPHDQISQQRTTVSTDILEILEYVATEVLQFETKPDRFRGFLSDYNALLKERDREILILRYANGLTLPQISKSIGLTHNQLQNRFHQHIFPDIKYVLNLYSNLQPKEIEELRSLKLHSIKQLKKAMQIKNSLEQEKRIQLAQILLTSINILPLSERQIIVKLFHDSLTSDQIAEQLGVKRYTVTNKKLRILTKLQKQITASLPTDKSIPTDQNDFEQFIRGLILFIPRTDFSEDDLYNITSEEDGLKLISYTKLQSTLNITTLSTIIQIIRPLIDPLDIQIINLYYVQGLNLTQTGEKIGKDYYFLQRYLKRNLFPALEKLINLFERLTPEQITQLANTPIHSPEQLEAVIQVRLMIPEENSRHLLTSTLLDKLNSQILANRKIILDISYKSLKPSDVAKSQKIPQKDIDEYITTAFRLLQNELTESLRSFDNTHIAQLSNPINLDEFKSFISGLIVDIPSGNFSTKQITLPTTIQEILKTVVKEHFTLDIDIQILQEVLADHAKFLTDEDRQLLLLRYAQARPLPEIAEKTNQSITHVTNRFKNHIFPQLQQHLAVFEGLSYKKLTQLRSLLAESLKQWSDDDRRTRQHQMVIYFAYDMMESNEIGIMLNISTRNNHHIRQVYNALNGLRTHFLEQIDSDRISNMLGGNIQNFKYFIRSMHNQIPREEFHVPRVTPQTEKWVLSRISASTLTKTTHYKTALMLKLFDSLDITEPQTHQQFAELSATLDLLSERQIEALELRYLKKLRNKDIGELFEISAKGVEQTITKAMKKIEISLEFNNHFSPQERSILRHIMAQTIDSLVQKRKDILVYTYYDRLSNQEIADIMGLSTHEAHGGGKSVTIRQMQNRFIERLPSPAWQKFFKERKNIDNLLYSLKAEIIRDRFTSTASKYNRQRTFISLHPQQIEALIPEGYTIVLPNQKYPPSFISNLWEKLGFDQPPTELELNELRSLLNILTEKEHRIIDYSNLPTLTIAQLVDLSQTQVEKILYASYDKLQKALSILQSIPETDRTSMRVAIATEITSMDIRNQRRKDILIYSFADGIPDTQVTDIIHFKRPNKTLQRFRAEKHRAIAFLQKSFNKPWITTPQKDLLSSNTDIIQYLLSTLYISVPRNYFNIPVPDAFIQPIATVTSEQTSPIQKNTIEQPIQSNRISTTIPEQKMRFTPQYVNKLFQEFKLDTTADMQEYLEYHAQHPDVALPHPLVLNSNPLFSRLRNQTMSFSDIQKIFVTQQKMNFSPWQIAQLQYILEKARFLPVTINRTDVLALDIDSLEPYLDSPYSRALIQKQFSRYINHVFSRYKKEKRAVNIILFSQKLSIGQIKALVGQDLFNTLQIDGNRIYSKEILKQFGNDTNNEQGQNLILSILTDYPFNRVNIKVFSQNTSIIKVAKSVGTIVASREDTLFDALAVLTNLQPTSAPNIPIYNSFFNVGSLVSNRKQGIFSLSGQEFANPNRRRIDNTVRFGTMIDKSL